MVLMDWDSSGISSSLFHDIGMAPRPMAVTVNGPRERFCMAENLFRREPRPRPPPRRSAVRRSAGSAGEFAYGMEPLPPKLIDLGTDERYELAVKRQLQYMISKGRVARQHWAVRVGADHSSRDGSLRAVVAIADTDLDACQRASLGAETGVSAMIFESGQPLLVTVATIPAAEDFTDGPDGPSSRGYIEQAQALDHVVVRANSE